MDEICKKYKIHITSDYICLNDIASKIIKSKNIEGYIKNIKQKKQIGNKYYVTPEKALSIIKNGTSKECKKIVNECLINDTKKIKQAVNTNAQTLDTFKEYNEYDSDGLNGEELNEDDMDDSDSDGYSEILSPFKFNDKQIEGLTDVDSEYWFDGKILTDMFELKSYPNDLFEQVSKENMLQGKDINLSEHDNISSTPNNFTFYVNETGIYELILCSTLPDADNFRQWLNEEVLQSLVSCGSYSAHSKTNPFKAKSAPSNGTTKTKVQSDSIFNINPIQLSDITPISAADISIDTNSIANKISIDENGNIHKSKSANNEI